MSSKKSSKKENKYISNINYPYEKTWDKLKHHVLFNLENINISTINGIRRTILSYVKTLAFRTEPYEKNDVKIIENDSKLHNQFICHRIGMIPIHFTDLESIFQIDDYEFIINVENNSKSNRIITTEDFKILKISTNEYLPKEKSRQSL